MAAANIVSSLFSILLFIYLARTLLPEALGFLSYVFTMIFFMANFIDLGLSTYGIRAIAKDGPRASDYLSEIASFRVLIAFLLSFVFMAAIALSGEANTVKILTIESLLILFTISLASEWAFQGLEKMHMVFISFLVTGALQLSSIFLFVKSSEDLFKVPLLYFAATLPVIIIFLRRLKFRLRIKRDDFRNMMRYLSSSMVLWSISIFVQIYNNFDIFILGIFRSIEEVGHFTVARRVIGAVTMFTLFLTNAVLPRLSHSYVNDTSQFRLTTKKFLLLMACLILFICLPLIIFSKNIIMFTVGADYVSADMSLKIMFLGLVLILFNLPYSTGLIAAGFEKDVLMQAFASAVISLISNFILIPKYGMIGAAVSFVLAEAVAITWILAIYKKKMCAVK